MSRPALSQHTVAGESSAHAGSAPANALSNESDQRPPVGRNAPPRRDLSATTVITWMAVAAAIVFAAVLFDLLNTDGYVGRWYTAVTDQAWAFDGLCIVLPCPPR